MEALTSRRSIFSLAVAGMPLYGVLALAAPRVITGRFPHALETAIALAGAGALVGINVALASPRRVARAERVAPWLLAFALVGLGAVTILVAFERVRTGAEIGMDLAKFTQSFWSTWNGVGLMVNTQEGGSHFAIHWSPSLLILLPIFGLAPSPLTLVCLRVIALLGGALPLYALLRSRLGSTGAATAALAYVASLPVASQLERDFYEIHFLPITLFAALLAAERGRSVWCCVLALVIAGIREETGAVVIALGWYAWRSLDRPKLAISLASIGLGSMVFAWGIGIPWASEGEGYVFGSAVGLFLETPYETRRFLRYVYVNLASVGFVLPFLGRYVVLGIPLFLGALLSHAAVSTILAHYGCGFGPAFLLSAADSGASLTRRWPRATPKPQVAVPLTLLSASIAFSLGPVWLPMARGDMLVPFSRREQPAPEYFTHVEQVLAAIPPDAAVILPRNFAPRMALRPWIRWTLLPDGTPGAATHVLIDTESADSKTASELNEPFHRWVEAGGSALPLLTRGPFTLYRVRALPPTG